MDKIIMVALLGLALCLPSHTEAFNLDFCMKNFTRAVYEMEISSIMQEVCEPGSFLLNCILNSDELKNAPLTDKMIDNMETMLNSNLAKLGVGCTIRDLRSKLKVQVISKSEPTVEQRCAEEALKAASNLRTLSEMCTVAEREFECILNGYPLALVEFLNIDQMKEKIDEQLSMLRVPCDLDLHGLVEARRRAAAQEETAFRSEL